MTVATPKMPLFLEENFTSELLNKLRSGQIDVAVTANTLSDTGFMTQRIYEENMVVAVPAHHPWGEPLPMWVPMSSKDQTMLLLGTGHCFRDQILGICPTMARSRLRPPLCSAPLKALVCRRSATWSLRAWASPCCRRRPCPILRGFPTL